jgi:hypothetical protein
MTFQGQLSNRLETADNPWGCYRMMIRQIEEHHSQYNDSETPKLLPSVIDGARQYINRLEERGETTPTLMIGTCDGTIVLEWHESEGDQVFRSLEVLSGNTAEEYIKYANGQSILRTVDTI